MSENCRTADHKAWSAYLTPKFREYMRICGSYSDKQENDHVNAFDEMLAVLGPPLPYPHTEGLLTHVGMPFEMSMNICDTREPIVRFELEPMTAATGSQEDPFGEECIPRSIDTVAAHMNTPIDLRWSHQLRQAFALTEEERPIARSKVPPHMDRISLCYFGAGMTGDQRTFKFCTSHWPKYFATSPALSPDSFVIETVRRLEPGGEALGPALDVLSEYLKDPKSLNPPSPLLFMGLDCVEPGKARVKLYGRTHYNNFATIRDLVTLGGRAATEENLEGLRRLKSIWHLLLNDPKVAGDENHNREPIDAASYRRGLLISFEVSAKNAMPEVKVYVPIFQCHENDAVAVRNTQEACRALGWDEWANGKYEKMVKALDDGPLESRMTHDYTSFNYSKRAGSYMTCYHVPVRPDKKA